MKGSELTLEMIKQAYPLGWFPMTVDEEENEVEWFQPHHRCLFPIEGIHVSKSLRKTIRQGKFEVTFDAAYEDVMWACRRPDDNWITADFVRVYGEAYRTGWGHSCEVWLKNRLVGGVYGVALGGSFFAESMFHLETDASKVALHALLETCQAKGFVLFDAQILNPHLKSLGAFTISKSSYLQRLQEALRIKTDWSC